MADETKTEKIGTLENAEDEIDITPRPNIRLLKSAEPIGEGRLAGGARDLFIVSAADQKAGWYSPNAGILRDMFRTHFELINYDASGKEAICENC